MKCQTAVAFLPFLVFIGNVHCDPNSTVVFNGADPGFYDISLNNFIGKTGKETKWTYKFTGRTGQKLSIHFLTKLEGNVEIKVYDGPSNGDTSIDITSISNNSVFFDSAFRAPYISATSNNMYIEITALTPPNATFVQDFQAIVTDHQNKVEDGCTEYLVAAVQEASTNTSPYNPKINLLGNNCINILRAVDFNNFPTVTGFIQFLNGTENLKVYKGLTISAERELLTNVDPFLATDRNILIKQTAPAKLKYWWGYLNSAVGIKSFNEVSVGSIMTRDYFTFLPQYLQKSFTQNFVFQPRVSSEYPLGSIVTLEFSILKKLGNSKLQIVTTDPSGNIVKAYNVTDIVSLPRKVSVSGPIIMLTYNNTDIPYTTGLYATYIQKSIEPPVTPKPNPEKGDGKASNCLYPITILVTMIIKFLVL